MMYHKRNRPVSTIGAALFMTGAAVLTTAGPAQAVQTRGDRPAPDFLTCKSLLDERPLIDAPGTESVGIDDFIVDTRNGRIDYALIDAHTVLGTAHSRVAIPYGALKWNSDKEAYQLQVTKKQLADLPEFDGGNMAYLQDDNWLYTLRGVFGDQDELNAARRALGDEYTLFFTQRKPDLIKGTIVSIDTNATTPNGAKCYAFTIKRDSNDERETVLLAPMAYMDTQSVKPKKDDEVRVNAVRAFDGSGHVVCVAQSVRVGDKEIQLRDDKGIPVWTSMDQRPGHTYFTLASHLAKGDLYARGDKFGHTQRTVIEAHSGTVAFAVVSVGDLLNVNEILYPIPFQSLTVGSNNDLFIDMPAEKVRVAPKFSRSRLDDLRDRDFVSRVLDYYGIDAEHPFDTGRSSAWLASAPMNAKDSSN